MSDRIGFYGQQLTPELEAVRKRILPEIEHHKRLIALERAVVDAAIAYTNAATELGKKLDMPAHATVGLFEDSIKKQKAMFDTVDALLEEREKQ